MIRKTQLALAMLFFFVAAFQASATIRITTTSLPSGQVSVGYRTALVATGGTSPLRWKVVSGALPAGLFFSESAGIIVGVPEQAANVTLNLAVTEICNTTFENEPIAFFDDE